jgi:hypothetical protein
MSATESASSRRRPGSRLAGTLAVLAVLGVIAVVVASAVSGGKGAAGAMYFTTYQDQAIYKVAVRYSQGHPQFGTQKVIARLPAADGVVFTPAGKALVGGQATGVVQEVDPANGAVTQVPSGCGNSFLLASAPSGHTVYTAGLPGALCAVPVDPLRPGSVVPLRGDDTQVTDIAFDAQGQAFYTTGVVSGTGNFGSIDLATGVTTRLLSGIDAGHGMAFDPYSQTLFLFGDASIFQIDPRHPQAVLSSMVVPSAQLDNGTTDGIGHLYVASNTGELVVVDYHQSMRLGDPRNVVTQLTLHNALDDVAPLIGPGAAGTRQTWAEPAAVALGLLAVVAALYRFLPSRGGGAGDAARLPEWDLRRQEVERRRQRAVRDAGRPARPGAPGRDW